MRDTGSLANEQRIWPTHLLSRKDFDKDHKFLIIFWHWSLYKLTMNKSQLHKTLSYVFQSSKSLIVTGGSITFWMFIVTQTSVYVWWTRDLSSNITQARRTK